MTTTSQRRYGAFTITELLVAIALVVILIILLIPAINTANESARTRRCSANQNRLALALVRFDSKEGRLPGWRHKVTMNGTVRWVGFAFPILPFLDQLDVYNAYMTGAMSLPSNVEIDTFICPTIGTTGGYRPGRIDYAANFGTGYGTDWLRRQEGQASSAIVPFKDDGALADAWANQSSSLSGIAAADGLSMTLLTTERDRIDWLITSANCFGTNVYQSQMRACNGFGLSVQGSGWVAPVGYQVINNTANGSVNPVSKHPGGVVASFADGSTRFLSDALPAHIYAHIVTSRSIFSSASPIRYGNNSNTANNYLRAPPAPASPFKVTENDL